MATLTISIQTEESIAQMVSRLDLPVTGRGDRFYTWQRLIKFLQEANQGTQIGVVPVGFVRIMSTVGDSDGDADKNFVLVQASAVDGDTLTIAGATFTAKTVPVDPRDFAIGASDAEMATNLNAAIAAAGAPDINDTPGSLGSTSLPFFWSSSSSAGELDIAALADGVAGNAITVETNNQAAFGMGAAIEFLSGGVESAVTGQVATGGTF